MADRETTILNAYQSTLAAEMSAVAGTATLTAVSGLVAPFYLVIEPDDAGQREYVYVSELNSNIATVANRYLTGSAAGSGLVHPNGSIVRHAFFSQHLVDINDRVDAVAAELAAVGDHGNLEGLTDDDHTIYLKEKASGGVASEVPEHLHTGASEAGQLDHGAALTGLTDDDHTIYLKEKASGGEASEVPEHTHASAAEGGVPALQVLEVDGITEDDTFVTAASYGDVVTVELEIPATWGSWSCTAYATFRWTGSDSGRARIQIDGTDQQEMDGLAVTNGYAIVSHRNTILTDGTRTIALRAENDGSGATMRDIALYARAVRTT